MADLPEQAKPDSKPPQAALAEDKIVPAKKTNGLISPIVADLISGVSSLAVGGVTAWGLIKERAYKNMSSLHLFEDMKKNRILKGEEIRDRIKAKTLTGTNANKELKALVNEFEGRAEKLMEDAGLGTTWQKFNVLRGHQKGEVIITALAYGGITLGSILLLTRGLFSKQEQQDLAKKGLSENTSIIQR